MRDSPAFHFRYVNETVGAVVLLSLVAIGAALAESGQIRRWFNPGQQIKVLLPQEGLFGLSAGASIEILGTRAGEVRSIVIDPDQQIHAITYIRRDMRPFVRQDSRAVIRKRFGVAGDAYIEVTRGFGAPLDWDYAVLKAEADRNATDVLESTMDEVRKQLLPAIGDARRALEAFANLGTQLQDPRGDFASTLGSIRQTAARLERGEGLAGALVRDDALVRDLRTLVAQLNQNLAALNPAIDDLRSTAKNAATMTDKLGRNADDLPKLIAAFQANLAALQAVLADLGRTTPKLPQIAANLADATAALPATTVQAQATLRELERLTRQLQSNWLLGGRRPAPEHNARLTPAEAAP